MKSVLITYETWAQWEKKLFYLIGEHSYEPSGLARIHGLDIPPHTPQTNRPDIEAFEFVWEDK
jgi:hypothetical protein